MPLLFELSFNSFSDSFIIFVLNPNKTSFYNISDGCFLVVILQTLDKSRENSHFNDFG